jgi:hypothetical protein
MPTEELELQIEGSAGTAYHVYLAREDSVLKTSCSCPAGKKRTHCKHRLSLFKGDYSSVRGEHPSALTQIISAMLQGTAVQLALNTLVDAEVEMSAAEAKLRAAKRGLDRAMHQ